MADLENAEVNRQLCAVATHEMFDSWSPESQEQILAEWNDWQEESEKSGLCCDACGRVYTRSDNRNRHMKSHSDKDHECPLCRKKFNRKARNLQGYISKHIKTF
jgi:hypothetical protein